MTDDDIPHGTRRGYRKFGCYCQACRDAENELFVATKGRAQERTPPDHVHGTLNGYNYWGCRCGECMAVKQESRPAERVARQRRKKWTREQGE